MNRNGPPWVPAADLRVVAAAVLGWVAGGLPDAGPGRQARRTREHHRGHTGIRTGRRFAQHHWWHPTRQNLDVTRFPVSENGSYDYSRDNIKLTRVAGTGYSGGGGTAKQIADSVRAGEGVVVIHGVDYNGNARTTSARAPAISTRACPPRRPSRPPVACSRSPSDPRPLRVLRSVSSDGLPIPRWVIANG
jgi:hypothetical protein